MRILWALVKKEFLQILRDPSSILIAFILPTILLLIYMYGLSLDSVNVNIGLKLDDTNPKVVSLSQSFSQNPHIKAHVYGDSETMYKDLVSAKLQGALIVPGNFTNNLMTGQSAQTLVITDGSNPNTANYVQSYSRSIVQQWLSASGYIQQAQTSLISSETRTWYNQDVNSHYFIVPGSVAVTLSLVGILLTALVVAREWERGTMEAILSSRITKLQFLLGKYLAYYVLGISSLLLNLFLCVAFFDIPFRGSYVVFVFVGSLFLLTCMGIGLLISTLTKNQFLASQLSLMLGFLPALMFSGLMFPISSMPTIFHYLTAIMPQRYFVSFIESEFLAGTIEELVLLNAVYLTALFILLFVVVYKSTLMRLEK